MKKIGKYIYNLNIFKKYRSYVKLRKNIASKKGQINELNERGKLLHKFIIENKFLKWVCIDADKVIKEVIGHETTFDLEQVNGKTRIRFSQSESKINRKLVIIWEIILHFSIV